MEHHQKTLGKVSASLLLCILASCHVDAMGTNLVEPVIMSKYQKLLAKHLMEHQQKNGIGKVNAFP